MWAHFWATLYNWPTMYKDAFKGKGAYIVLREIHLRTTGRHLSMGSHSVICHPTEVTAPPRLHPNRAGWYSIY